MQQQQVTPQEQYGSQHQMQQPMFMCPVQFVYDPTQMIIPQAHDEQAQQNQTILINVQNPPPWIQNRPQNYVYVQQTLNNMQPLLQQNMVQNPMFQQAYSYQMMPTQLIPQEMRPAIQMPSLIPSNMIQNQAQMVAPVESEKTSEKMPVLTQILNQNANNIRPTLTTMQNPQMLTNLNPNANDIRPVMQNQQVQTDLPGPNFKRPRGPRPQVTINPMQQSIFIPNSNQKPNVINVPRTLQPNMTNFEMPQHIRNKIPSQISVKSIYKPILPRPTGIPTVRPFEMIPGPQNVFYNPNFVTLPETQTRNSMMNTDFSYLKQKIYQEGERNSKSVGVDDSTFKKYCTSLKNHEDDEIYKQSVLPNLLEKEKFDLVKIYENSKFENSSVGGTQSDEKLIRNTVFTQARGRVLNDKEIQKNVSPKRTIADRIQEETVDNVLNNKEHVENDSKKIKVEATEVGSHISNNFEAIKTLAPSTPILNTIKPPNMNSSPMKTLNIQNRETKTITPDKKPIAPQIDNINDNVHQISSIENGKDYNSENTFNMTNNVPVTVDNNPINQTNDSSTNLNTLSATVPFSLGNQNCNLPLTYNNFVKNGEESILNTDKSKALSTLAQSYENKAPLSTDNLGVKVKTCVENGYKPEKLQTDDKDDSFEDDRNLIIDESAAEEEISNEKNKLAQDDKTDSKSEESSFDSVTKGLVVNKANLEDGDKFVLTHVLGGHVIQESNVAFPIHKPLNEKENSKKPPKGQTKAKKKKTTNKKQDVIDVKNIDVVPLLPTRYLHNKIDSDEAKDVAVHIINKDDPFAGVLKSTVQSWTVDQLSAHLAKHDWKETALKLQDQEIDGESILLVNKEQLVCIGVSEQHAEVIAAFVTSK